MESSGYVMAHPDTVFHGLIPTVQFAGPVAGVGYHLNHFFYLV
jgi:hypothetical protein